MYQPVFSLKTGWIVRVIDNHIAKPLTEEEVTQVCNRLNSIPLEAGVRPDNGGKDERWCSTCTNYNDIMNYNCKVCIQGTTPPHNYIKKT